MIPDDRDNKDESELESKPRRQLHGRQMCEETLGRRIVDGRHDGPSEEPDLSDVTPEKREESVGCEVCYVSEYEREDEGITAISTQVPGGDEEREGSDQRVSERSAVREQLDRPGKRFVDQIRKLRPDGEGDDG